MLLINENDESLIEFIKMYFPFIYLIVYILNVSSFIIIIHYVM